VRYALQGTPTVWTDTARTFYVEDPNLGFVPTTDAWMWLGLEGLGAIVGALAGVLVMRWLASRKGEGAGFGRIAGVLASLGSVLLLAAPVLPVMAFVGGRPPAGAIAVLPSADGNAKVAGGGGAVTVDAPGGVYTPAPRNELHLVAAQITAGGEKFDARFTGLSGQLELDPKNLAASKAVLAVEAATVRTGVPLRDKHALDYLKATEFPTIRVRLEGVDAVAPTERPGDFTWSGTALADFMGRTLRRPANGRFRVLNATARTELGVDAPAAILVEATFPIAISETELDRQSFESDTIEITARAVLVPSR
jgi:polyisoprenoid-binding protein YceI